MYQIAFPKPTKVIILKGQYIVYEAVQAQRHKRDLLDTKNYMKIILDTSCVCRPYAMWSPKTLREGHARIKLQKDMHRLWGERKALFQLKSDDELACFLLGLVKVPMPFISDEFSQDTEPFTEELSVICSKAICSSASIL